MRNHLLLLGAALACGLASLAWLAPAAGAAPSIDDATPGGGDPSTIVVQIQTRGAPDEPIGKGMKERDFRLYCPHCWLNPIITVRVEFDAAKTTPLQLAQKFKERAEEVLSYCENSEACEYSIEVGNNSLLITGIGADRYAGTIENPVYEGEAGEDFTDDGKPKKSPRCRLEIYAL